MSERDVLRCTESCCFPPEIWPAQYMPLNRCNNMQGRRERGSWQSADSQFGSQHLQSIMSTVAPIQSVFMWQHYADFTEKTAQSIMTDKMKHLKISLQLPNCFEMLKDEEKTTIRAILHNTQLSPFQVHFGTETQDTTPAKILRLLFPHRIHLLCKLHFRVKNHFKRDHCLLGRVLPNTLPRRTQLSLAVKIF